MTIEAPGDEMRAVAQMFGVLLLREIDEGWFQVLQDPGLRALFERIGIEVPDPATATLDDLAAAFFAEILQPEHGAPLVQSLHEEGEFEGEASRSVRAIADAFGLEHDASEMRGTPVDHLGCEILLWDELADRDPSAAQEFARRHLPWAVPPLRRASRTTFYGQLQHAVARWIESVIA